MWTLIATIVASAPCEQTPYPRSSVARPVVLPESALEVGQRLGIGTNFVTAQGIGITDVRGSPACALQLRATAFQSLPPFQPLSTLQFAVARSIAHSIAIELEGSYSPPQGALSAQRVGIALGAPLRFELLPWIALIGLDGVFGVSWTSTPQMSRGPDFVLSLPFGLILQPIEAWAFEVKARSVFAIPTFSPRVEVEATTRVSPTNRLDLVLTFLGSQRLVSAPIEFTVLAGVSVRFFGDPQRRSPR